MNIQNHQLTWMEVEEKNQGHTSVVKFIQKYFSIGATLNGLLCFESSLLYRNVVAFYIFILKPDWICFQKILRYCNKTQLREIKENMVEWKNISSLWTAKISTVKIFTLLKATYGFKAKQKKQWSISHLFIKNSINSYWKAKR